MLDDQNDDFLIPPEFQAQLQQRLVGLYHQDDLCDPYAMWLEHPSTPAHWDVCLPCRQAHTRELLAVEQAWRDVWRRN